MSRFLGLTLAAAVFALATVAAAYSTSRNR